MHVDGILETSVYADDLPAARAFYEGVLGLPFLSEVEGRHVFFKLGNGMFLVFRPSATLSPESELPPHGAEGPGHVAFRVDEAAIPAWREHLQAEDVEIESDFTWSNGLVSLYFRDPAGNLLEITTGKIWGYEKDA